MERTIENILKEFTNILDIKNISKSKHYKNHYFTYIYKFNITGKNFIIPAVMGIPDDWDRSLISIYIENYQEIDLIPHLEEDGHLCLFDLEGVIIDTFFKGVLFQTLTRLNKILDEGINRVNEIDFIDEFEDYWCRLPGCKNIKSFISVNREMKLIKYSDNIKGAEKGKKEKYIDILIKRRGYYFVASDTEQDFKLLKNINMIRNGLYISIDSNDYIFPPDWRKKLDISFINTLVNHISIDQALIKEKIRKCKSDLFIIFSIKQPNSSTNLIGMFLRNVSVNYLDNQIALTLSSQAVPCHVRRCDSEYLINRGGAITVFGGKKILVIGCGSIGGYLIEQLVKIGFNDITVIDDDLLTEDNIYRHLLGFEYISEFKSKAISDYIEKNIPKVKIRCMYERIEALVLDESIVLRDFDLIVSTVGNHNVNRWINNYVFENNVQTPIVYLWNEVLGIGNHVAFISTAFTGCYDCFIRRGEDSLYDATSYCEKGQVFNRKYAGCNSSFMPYGATHSQKSVQLGIKVITDFFKNRLDHSFIMSLKGDDLLFKQAGFVTSSRYNTQKEYVNLIKGDIFKKDGCFCQKNGGV